MISRIARTLLTLLLILAAGLIGLWYFAPPLSFEQFKLTENVVQRTVITELRSENPAAFLVTGIIELTADITEENTKYFFPEYFDDSFSLGTTRSNVRLPGRVTYGVNLQGLDASHISYVADSLVIINLPKIEIQSVEADLASMQVWTDVGWARLHSRSGRAVERRAMIEANEALRTQGDMFVQTNPQALRNTELAFANLLRPVLLNLGIKNPVVRCQYVPDLLPPTEVN